MESVSSNYMIPYSRNQMYIVGILECLLIFRVHGTGVEVVVVLGQFRRMELPFELLLPEFK